MTPFFSIIIPVYNVAPYLRECLNSVSAQSFSDWEAICVDDGSTDGSGEILDEYAAKDSRFRVIHQSNTGVSAARNVALKFVRGRYVGFVDGDDVVLPWHLSVLHELSCRCEFADLIRELRSVPYDVRRKEMKAKADRIKLRSIQGRDVFSFITKEVVRNGLPSLNYFRADIIKGLEFPVGVKFAEDGLFFCRAIPRINRICFAEVATYCYRENRQGCATNNVEYDDAVRFVSDLNDVFSCLSKELPYVEKEIPIAFTNFLLKVFKRFRMGAGVGSDASQCAYLEALRLISKTAYFDDSEIPLRYRLAFRFFLMTGSYSTFRFGSELSSCIRNAWKFCKQIFWRSA